MKVYLVFEHDWEGLIFKGIYEHLDAAVEHARAIHQHAIAEVHEAYLHEKFFETCLSDEPTTVLWTSFTHSGAI